MSQDEHTGAAPDDTEKTPPTPKKQQGKRRSPGARPDAEAPPRQDGGEAEESEEAVVAEASADRETGAPGQEPNPPETDKQPSAASAARENAARVEDLTGIERHEVATKEAPKPRSLGEILRFGRKSAKRPR